MAHRSNLNPNAPAFHGLPPGHAQGYDSQFSYNPPMMQYPNTSGPHRHGHMGPTRYNPSHNNGPGFAPAPGMGGRGGVIRGPHHHMVVNYSPNHHQNPNAPGGVMDRKQPPIGSFVGNPPMPHFNSGPHRSMNHNPRGAISIPFEAPRAQTALKEPPKVILVTGYRRTGKTTVAKELAASFQYEYISLLQDGKGDEEETTLVGRLAPLAELLKPKRNLKGIVIDDALVHSKFDAYYVMFMVSKAGLQLDTLVIITSELNDLQERQVEFTTAEMQAHPESFEFGQQLEDMNGSGEDVPIVVVEAMADLSVVASDAIRQVKETDARRLRPLRLQEVEFVPGCPLVSDPALVEDIISAECMAIGVNDADSHYDFPYVEPNFLLDYVQFVKTALRFKHYMIVPWIWGDKISILGYGEQVYIHLPSYKIVFHMKEMPAVMKEMIAVLKAQKEAHGGFTPTTLLFSLEAVMLDNIIYISDMMLMGEHLGSLTVLPERVRIMNTMLGMLPASGPIRLLQHFTVPQISECIEMYESVARGVLFVNPDGMQVGNYESRNFIYPCEHRKTVQLRIWGGRWLKEANMWAFDAYAREDAVEVKVGGDNPIPVYISDKQVSELIINDGNVLECILQQDSPLPNTKGKRGGKGAQTSSFVFQKRCKWQVSPTTLYYQSAFVAPPAWPTELFLEACRSVEYEAVTQPE